MKPQMAKMLVGGRGAYENKHTGGKSMQDIVPLQPIQAHQGISTATHCPYCAFQCGVCLAGPREQATTAGDAAFPVNKGGLFNGGQLIVVDPRTSATTKAAALH